MKRKVDIFAIVFVVFFYILVITDCVCVILAAHFPTNQAIMNLKIFFHHGYEFYAFYVLFGLIIIQHREINKIKRAISEDTESKE